MKTVRTKKDIENHPGVKSIHKEDDGCWDTPAWWVYLKEGWISPEMECGTIHERTLKDVCDKVNNCSSKEELCNKIDAEIKKS